MAEEAQASAIAEANRPLDCGNSQEAKSLGGRTVCPNCHIGEDKDNAGMRILIALKKSMPLVAIHVHWRRTQAELKQPSKRTEAVRTIVATYVGNVVAPL